MQTAGGKKELKGSPPKLTLKYVSKSPSGNNEGAIANQENSPYERSQNTANTGNNKRKKIGGKHKKSAINQDTSNRYILTKDNREDNQDSVSNTNQTLD